VTNEIAFPSRGEMSDAIAAATRKSAALGIAIRSIALRPKSASEKPAATTRIISAKVAISFIPAL